MRRRAAAGILAAGLLWTAATACHDMHDQPSFKAQEGPRRTVPQESVPLRGREVIRGRALMNPFPSDDASVARGRELFGIHCAMCHGPDGRGDGPVGRVFAPRPADLHQPRIQRLSDADLYRRITVGFGAMPAFGRRIAVPDRWHLVNALREFREGPPAS